MASSSACIASSAISAWISALANNIEGLVRGLAALSQELGGEWRNTVVAVVSEFGRTFRENGNKGTDHRHGSVHWVLGGSINGAVFGGLFATLWGLSADQVQRVFPGSLDRRAANASHVPLHEERDTGPLRRTAPLSAMTRGTHHLPSHRMSPESIRGLIFEGFKRMYQYDEASRGVVRGLRPHTCSFG
jgi:hypothetical protein